MCKWNGNFCSDRWNEKRGVPLNGVHLFCKFLFDPGIANSKGSIKTFWLNGRHPSGAPNGSFLSDPLKRNFRLSGVLLKLCRFNSSHAIIFLSVRSFWGNLSLFEIIRAFLSIFRKPFGVQNDIFMNSKTLGRKYPASARTFEVKIPLRKL